jgi:hypothetical protein
MTRLRCGRVPHLTYSSHLTICDFCLFGRIKERLAEVTVVDADDLRNEVTSILAGISEDEKSRVFKHSSIRAFKHSSIRTFDHWIERDELVAEHEKDYYHAKNGLADLISRHRTHRARC